MMLFNNTISILSQQTSIIKMAEKFEGRSVEKEDGENVPATKIARNSRIQYNKKVQQIDR